MALANTGTALKIVGALVAVVPVVGSQLEALTKVANELCTVAEGVQTNREGFVNLAHEAARYAAAVADSVQRSHPPVPAAIPVSAGQTTPADSTSPVHVDHSKKHIETLTETLKEIEKVISERKEKDDARAKKIASGLRRALRDTVKKGSDQETLTELRAKLNLAVKAFSIAADVHGADMMDRLVEQMKATSLRQETLLMEEKDRHIRWQAEAEERHRKEALVAEKRRREEVLKHLETKLMPVHDARYDSSQTPSGCMANTRVKLLAELESWIGSDGERIYWLSGLAGTGKSTVASSLCTLLAEHGLLAVSFFVSRNSADRRDARSIARTLAFQLARHFPVLQEHLHTILVEHPDTLSRPVGDLITKLIVDPLVNIVWSASPPVIVIDAFDECDMQDGYGGGNFLPQLLLPIRRGSLPLRLFVTSRPHPSIEKIFTGTQMSRTDSYLSLKLHNIEHSIVQRDIELYLETSFQRIARLEPELADHTWPEPSTLKILVARAGVLFIYAATVVRYVEDPVDVPSVRLKSLITQDFPLTGLEYEMLDELYLQILKGCVGKETDRNNPLCVRLRIVAGSLVHLQDPLSLITLSALLNMERAAARRMLESLSSLLIYDDRNPIRLFHPSFPDFIGNADRCRDLRFYIVADEQHTLLARCCLTIMNRYLKYDICGIQDPSLLNSEVSNLPERLTDSVPAELVYASKYWMTHLSRSSAVHDNTLLKELRAFAEKHLLHWVEVLSLLAELSSAVYGLPGAIKWCRATGDDAFAMASLFSDAERTIQEYYAPISASALQVYHSALTFMPHCSLHRLLVGTSYHSPHLCSQRHPKWSALLRTLEGHKRSVKSVVFSKDGTRLASGSDDMTVCVWDVNTGNAVATLVGHTGKVLSVAFSLDGTCIASGSDDATVRMWDVNTGDVVSSLNVHKWQAIYSVVFSPDGTRFAAGSNDATVRVWDMGTGELTATLNGHHRRVNSVAFSPDGTRLASGSSDKTVRLWDVNTGDVVATLVGHDRGVKSVAFLPDGTRLASGSNDTTVRLWDMSTGDGATLNRHNDPVRSVAFSPDGARLASGSDYAIVRLWDVSTGEIVATLNGHTDFVCSVTFSPDGTRLASGADDGSVRFWDTSTGGVATLNGHTDLVYCVVFSPDGTRLASTSVDATVHVWDVSTGNIVATSKISDGRALSVTFSPDGTRLAMGVDDSSVRVWDMKLDFIIATLDGHDGMVYSVAFSADGNYLASGSQDTTVRVWDMNRGRVVSILESRSNGVYCVAFSPDGTRLAAGSGDMIVRVWDLSTRRVAAILTGHVDQVFEVSWSLNGLEIFSRDWLGNSRNWRAESNFPIHLGNSADEPELRSAQFTFSIDKQTGWASCSRTTDGFTKRVCWVPSGRRPVGSRHCVQAGARVAVGAASGVITVLDLTDWLSTWMSV